jgi:glutathione S-transferase
LQSQPKLYYTTSSCGAASFTAAYAAGLSMECEQVDIREHKTTTGADYYKINPKGNVPCLVLDDGTVLNEGAAVLQFIADQAPGKIAPENGSNGRYLVQNMLNYIASEVHASIGPLFNPSLTPEMKAHVLTNYLKKVKYVNDVLLNDKEYLVGSSVTIADFYLYITLTWVGYVGADISPYTNVLSYVERIKTLPAVVAATSLMATNPAKTH